jgi:ribonuclease D
MDYENITTDDQLCDYCRELAAADSIAFDTEFVSEHTYRPVLCLVQVAAAGRLAVIDALAVNDMRPFWDAILAAGHETVVHAGRGEMEFCLHATGQIPARLFDVQIAAGLAGYEYPAGFGTLVSRILNQTSQKHETRTDWQRRPLSKRQIEYALEDALYLHPLCESLRARLREQGRLSWLEAEMADWREDLQRSVLQEHWRRVSGNAGLSARSLAIVRELWKWRDAEAQRRDQPARRVLRDDLIIELARRQTADVKRIRAVRGMERGDLLRRVGDMAAAIQRALTLAEEQCPTRSPREPSLQLSVLGQFLFAALGSICRQAQLAPNLVGSPNDIRELINYRANHSPEGRRPPRLAHGWREQFVGHLFEDLLAGKVAIRIRDPEADYPLVFERAEQSGE